MRRIPILLALLALLGSAPLLRHYSIRRPPKTFVQRSELFDRPASRAEMFRLNLQLQKGLSQNDFPACLQIAERMTTVDSEDPMAWYHLACLLAVNLQTTRALDALEMAVSLGFRDPARLASEPALQTLNGIEKMDALLKKAAVPWHPVRSSQSTVPNPGSQPITGRVANVSEQNTHWNEEELSLITEFAPPAPEVVPIAAEKLLTDSPAAALVQTWIDEKSAAGFAGVLYDNRDRDHSTLQHSAFPALAFVEYEPAVQAANADFGIRPGQRFNLPTFGNASTSYVTPIFWRSNARMLLTDPLLTTLTAQSYLKNQLYCYPEHNDFDPEFGDVFPVNVPFWLLSQGSSGSDQPFLKAIALTLAAFPADVRSQLQASGLLMHTVQYILRRSLRFVQSEDDYFTGQAHPVVFQHEDLDVQRMVQMAHDMQPLEIPPVVRLQVLDEDHAIPGIDYFSAGQGEVLLNTPLAIGRIFRTLKKSRRMVVDASDSADLRGSPLSFRWVVLQGDPQKIQIRPLNDSGSRAEIRIEWHERAEIPWRKGMWSSRVDIGVFAQNRESCSMPGLICSMTLASEKRDYQNEKLLSVDYAAPDRTHVYTDPLLVPVRNWRDDYTWSDTGTMTGWIRWLSNQQPVPFDAAGRMKFTAEDGQVQLTPVQYQAETNASGVPELKFSVVQSPN